MRYLFAASVLAAALHSVPASAQDYAYCRFGNTDCNYSTFAQCRATASGTFGDCRRNPRFFQSQGFGFEGGGAPIASPAYDSRARYVPRYRHHRHHHHHE